MRSVFIIERKPPYRNVPDYWGGRKGFTQLKSEAYHFKTEKKAYGALHRNALNFCKVLPAEVENSTPKPVARQVYTMSRDGVERTSLVFTERVTREELVELNKKAITCGYEDYHGFVESQMGNLQMRLDDMYNDSRKLG